MIIDCIGDLHGHYPELEGGDLLIVAGDLTASDTVAQHEEFTKWFKSQNYKKRIVIPGNHDNHLEDLMYSRVGTTGMFKTHCPNVLLWDSGIEFEGLKIWGSPWTLEFEGMNPLCKAFTLDTEAELEEKWMKIPSDVDILVTHSPPYGKMDQVLRHPFEGYKNCGSHSLNYYVQMHQPKLHVFGHIHEGYGYLKDCLHYVNASHVNERYQPVNKPVRVIL